MLLWIHLLATGAFAGATSGLALFALPHARASESARTRRARIAHVLRIYDPLAIGLLGLMVMTGAWLITGIKADMGGLYFDDFGRSLALKLALAFLVVMSGTWVAMGIGHRIVREEDWGEDVDEQQLGGRLRRLSAASWTATALTLATVWISLQR